MAAVPPVLKAVPPVLKVVTEDLRRRERPMA
jgi:hypothetical protein